MADPRVVALRPEHIEQCVRLHRQAFPDFFLSQLGTRFLAEFYRAFRSAPDAARGVAVDGEGRVPGVVVGTTRPGGFFSRLLKQRWLALAWAYFEHPCSAGHPARDDCARIVALVGLKLPAVDLASS